MSDSEFSLLELIKVQVMIEQKIHMLNATSEPKIRISEFEEILLKTKIQIARKKAA